MIYDRSRRDRQCQAHLCHHVHKCDLSWPIFDMLAGCTGLVFLAFALNLVDCGGLLGGRLGDSRPPRKHRKSASMQPLQGAGLGERTLTCKF